MTKEMPRVMCSAGQEERCYCRSRRPEGKRLRHMVFGFSCLEIYIKPLFGIELMIPLKCEVWI